MFDANDDDDGDELSLRKLNLGLGRRGRSLDNDMICEFEFFKTIRACSVGRLFVYLWSRRLCFRIYELSERGRERRARPNFGFHPSLQRTSNSLPGERARTGDNPNMIAAVISLVDVSTAPLFKLNRVKNRKIGVRAPGPCSSSRRIPTNNKKGFPYHE